MVEDLGVDFFTPFNRFFNFYYFTKIELSDGYQPGTKKAEITG